MSADGNRANTVNIITVAHTSDTGVSYNTMTQTVMTTPKMNIILQYTTERVGVVSVTALHQAVAYRGGGGLGCSNPTRNSEILTNSNRVANWVENV